MFNTVRTSKNKNIIYVLTIPYKKKKKKSFDNPKPKYILEMLDQYLRIHPYSLKQQKNKYYEEIYIKK